MSGDIELYQPSSGTEGECFMGEWCEKCTKDSLDPDAKTKCPIICFLELIRRICKTKYRKNVAGKKIKRIAHQGMNTTVKILILLSLDLACVVFAASLERENEDYG